MFIDTCPPPADLERLFLGGLPEKEIDVVEQHVLQCGPCLESLKSLFRAKDTLAGVLSAATSHDALDSSPAVEDLIHKLTSLSAASSNRPPRGTAMITFACSACQKTLSIKEDLAGKKVKCPGCGQVQLAVVPAKVAAGATDDQRTLPPVQPQDSHVPTPSASSHLDATEGVAPPNLDLDASLTDFLAPAQAAGELGRLGKYRILKMLGHGGMGVVFKAEDTKLKRSVAIKAMLPTLAASASAGQRFLREAEAMAALEHDHVVRIYQVDEDRGVPFMAMEFLKGEPLDERLKREEKLPLAEVLRIGREIADGLGAAHATGLIHRDIKPANIWLEAPRARVKILDFGLARAASQDAGLTQQGAIIGTPAYMAPEQGRGETVDARCDLFSLGVVLYRLCSGRQPFRGNDSVSTLLSIAMDQPTAPILVNFELPQELSDLVMRLLEKDPAKRIATAGEVVTALQAMEKKLARLRDAEDRTTTLPALALPSRPIAAPRRRLPVFVAAAVLLVGLVGLGLWATGIIRFQSDDGEYVIETDDPDFSFQVAKGGGVMLKDSKTGREYKLKVVRHDKATGEYELDVTDVGGDLTFKTKQFTIKRGEKVALKARFIGPPVVAVKPPVDDDWIKTVAAMPAEQQVVAVAAKLKERNPGFDGKETHKIEGGVVTELTFFTDNITDISPVRALTGLRILSCSGSVQGKGQLADLSPLKDMPIWSLNCQYTQVSDLSPLKDMKLTRLQIGCSQVSDLSPLKDMKLTYLNCDTTRVSDLSPLKDMKLTIFACPRTKVSDLTPLRGMPLISLSCDFKPERDAALLRSLKTLVTINLKPAAEFWKDVDAQLAGFDAWLKQVATMPPEKQVDAVATMLKERNPGFDGKVKHKIEGRAVTVLEFVTDKVTDIAPVRALTGLRMLDCPGSAPGKGQLADLSPLRNLELDYLDCNNTQVSDLSPLKNMNLTYLHCDRTRVSDLSPLKEMKLSYLDCSDTPVSDLSPLKDMKMTQLDCEGTRVSDLSPLKDMKMTLLYCDRTPVTDLSPLREMPLQKLRCVFKPERDAEILRSIKTLVTINGKPAAEFWKDVDAQLAGFDAWLKQVAALPPEQQVDAVAAKLKERNPGFDGKVIASKIEGGVVTILELSADKVSDISPVRALTELRSLSCTGTRGQGPLFADLNPLKGMKLTALTCVNTKVADLSPLQGMMLGYLNLSGAKVSDLSPLKDMKLHYLNCSGTPVSDLSPLKDMPITRLWCAFTPVTDLSPLRGMPLKELHCTFKPERDAEILRAIKTLETINDKPAAEFWKDVDAKKP